MGEKIEFSDIMASTMHDTKNSLGMLLNITDEIMTSLNIGEHAARHQFYHLQYEIKRLNSSLIRLLALYKAEKSQLLTNIDFHSVNDFMEDVVLHHEQLLEARGIKIKLDAPEALFWAFDRRLIAGVLDNVLNNAYRYAKDEITLSASQQDGFLMIAVADNGAGYPEDMLVYGPHHPKFKEDISFDSGSTGLGLYFSSMIARLHSRDQKSGYITLCNGGEYGGGVFSLFIP